VYRIADYFWGPEIKHTSAGAMDGIVEGPDGRIWFVEADPANKIGALVNPPPPTPTNTPTITHTATITPTPSNTNTPSVTWTPTPTPTPTVTQTPSLHVAAIAPSSGPAAGGTAVAVAGTGFLPGASLTIGGVMAEDVVVVGETEIDASTPVLEPGSLNVVSVGNAASRRGRPLTNATLPAGFLADFLDVAQENIFHDSVESVFRSGITAGCGAGNYCCSLPVTRAQMAVLLLKAKYSSGHIPAPCQGVFSDVACPGPFADWIEELYAEGISGGCGEDVYCPADSVTRAQMAVFLLKARHGSSYTPPSCTGLFQDVECASQFASWIEELSVEEVTGGCSTAPLLYCPSNSVTRGQMAAFLVKTFSLP
jgi:hypothetical protein